MKKKRPDRPLGELDATRPGPADTAFRTPDEGEEWLMETPEDSRLKELEFALRYLPDHDPPETLLPNIMSRLQPRKRSLPRRLWDWTRQPFSVTFTPLHLVPALCLLLVFLGFTAYTGFYFQFTPSRMQIQTAAGVPVMLSISMPHARKVSVIGSFNNWRPQVCQQAEGDSDAVEWTLVLTLPPGRYEYAYVIDDSDVIPDPWNETLQDDGFGNRNSVLYVGNGHESSI